MNSLLILMLYFIPLIIGIIFAKYFEEDGTGSKGNLITLTMIPAVNIPVSFICVVIMFYYLLDTITKNNK